MNISAMNVSTTQPIYMNAMEVSNISYLCDSSIFSSSSIILSLTASITNSWTDLYPYPLSSIILRIFSTSSLGIETLVYAKVIHHIESIFGLDIRYYTPLILHIWRIYIILTLYLYMVVLWSI